MEKKDMEKSSKCKAFCLLSKRNNKIPNQDLLLFTVGIEINVFVGIQAAFDKQECFLKNDNLGG